MKHLLVKWGSACLLTAALAACGGGGGSAVVAPVVPNSPAIVAASTLLANDSATNSAAPFTVLQDAGIPAVIINSPPKVNFVVFSDGAVKTGLTISNVSVAIAQLVPGTNGDPDVWKNYTSRTRAAAPSATGYSAAVSATLTTPKLATAIQAYTDPKQSDTTLLASQLAYNPLGYYTYTFRTDITDSSKTNGVVYDRTKTHRVAIQLSYTNAAGEIIKANPYFDFTIDASGNAVAVTDTSKTRKMTDVSSCNGCHEKLALHGGGRVDTQYCVMCHNPGTTDPNSGNVLTLATMVHKIHAGKLLKATTGGENYTVRTADYAEVGFPQDLRNCTVCHSGTNPKTPQGDNWKTKPSKEACLTCHANNIGSRWETTHVALIAMSAGAGTPAKSYTNQQCAECHKVGSAISPERVHWNQNEENSAKYKMNIESVAFNDTTDHKARSVTVNYYLSDPTNANAAYNLVTSDCTNITVLTCTSSTKFGNLRFYLGYQNMVGQSSKVAEFTAYNNGGSTAVAYAYKGVNDGNNHYSVAIPLPDDTAIAIAAGTARVISIGQVKEPKLQVASAIDPRPAVTPQVLINVVAQNAYKELAISGVLVPRRTIVTTEKCNACHGTLDTTSGSNTKADAFHSGDRNRVEACVLCHDVNRMSSTLMTNGTVVSDLYPNGTVFNESYQFKRLIHGIHGSSKRAYPFTKGNKDASGGAFNKDGTSTTLGGASLASNVENFAAEVSWPGVGINCNVCHVDNSYKKDQGTLGSVIKKPFATGSTTVLETDPYKWVVISPKAASCTACHDGLTKSGVKVIDHITWFGGATFGGKTQADVATLPPETCDECHASGAIKGVDTVHGQK